MLLYPKVQQAAQEEIDRVIGSDRLPAMTDRSLLPYIDRLVKEVLRWRPPLPSGVPHACYQDDEFNGYRIPKGAIVWSNGDVLFGRAISHDSEVYEDPEVFEPDRFLDISVPAPPTFGFGRRICPGLHYAGASLFMCISTILATFKIERVQDAGGHELLPVPENLENSAI
ncbi:cytochrome P450 1B1, partial [Ceratobasidium sp. 392]